MGMNTAVRLPGILHKDSRKDCDNPKQPQVR